MIPSASGSHAPYKCWSLDCHDSSSKLDPHISRKSSAYLFEPDALFVICTLLVGRGLEETLHDLARLRPDDSVWHVCLTRLHEDAYPAHLSDRYNIPGTLADLKTFLDGGGVGLFGSRLSEQMAQEDDGPPIDSPKDPWRNAWHRVRRYITRKDTAHEDIQLSNISGPGGV